MGFTAGKNKKAASSGIREVSFFGSVPVENLIK